ncbi:hypothetical protein COX86_00900, partial [Candidatus Micrarchaeota archaeon CG_4_10_14_0_2_um_filter_60_11]
NPPTISGAAPLAEMMRFFEKCGEEFALVLDNNGKPIGIVTDGDVLRAFYVRVASHAGEKNSFDLEEALRDRVQSFKTLKVEDAMTRRPKTVPEDSAILQAAELFRKNNLKRAPVVDAEGKAVGFLKRADLAAAALEF